MLILFALQVCKVTTSEVKLSSKDVYLTPAQQMKRIRENVNSADIDSSDKAYILLTHYASRIERLREDVRKLESKTLIKQHPFVSHAPVIGPLIVKIRTFWNWMSTKWYALPLIRQQNDYNMAVSQALRDVVAATESLSQSIRDLQIRLAALEENRSSSDVE